MPSQSLLQLLGSKGDKETRYAPIFTDRFFVGLWTNRNPLRSPLSTFYADGWHLGGTDALIGGTNIELSPRLTLCRRPGNLSYSTATIPTPPLTFYSFLMFGGAIDLITDTASTIYVLTPTNLTSIFVKGAGAGQANFLGIGNTLYFGDGVEVEAWQNGTIRNWGISIGPFSSAVGPNTATAGSDTGLGTYPWSNPSYVTGSAGYAQAFVHGSGGGVSNILDSDTLLATNFGITIPITDTVSGIAVSFNGYATGTGSPGTTVQFNVWLTYNGGLIGSPKIIPAPNTPTTFNLGGSGDLWGASIGGANVSDSSFGVAIIAQINLRNSFSSASFNFNAQNVTLTVDGTFGPAVTLVSGTLTATTGYTYVAAYGNSNSGQVSSSTPSSALVVPSGQGVQISLVASTDPQVNQIWLFRTADGGSTYLNLPTSPYPNVTQNVVDNAPDSLLNILQQAPIDFQNNPPLATSLDPVQYLGLVWVHSGNAVYFSRTPSAVVGITQESFPPANVFTFPEEVIRKIPINSGLLIYTTSNIYIIAGQNTSTNPLASQPFLSGYGILSWNALWLDGSIIYFFTSDKRSIRLDPSAGVEDMGFPIGDLLSGFNPASVYVTYLSASSLDTALYLGDGSTGWYRCNPNQAPDGQITGPVWSPKATITQGCGALVAVQTAPGIHQLFLGGTGDAEPVLYRDSSYTNFTDNLSPYEANFQIGSVVLAQPGQVALMRFIAAYFKRLGNAPTVSVLLGEISGTFENISGYVVNDPPYLPASTSMYNNRYYFKQTVGGANPEPAMCEHLQIGIDYGTDQVQNELLSLTINGAHVSER